MYAFPSYSSIITSFPSAFDSRSCVVNSAVPFALRTGNVITRQAQAFPKVASILLFSERTVWERSRLVIQDVLWVG